MQDSTLLSITDLSFAFLCTEADVGKMVRLYEDIMIMHILYQQIYTHFYSLLKLLNL